MPSPAPKSKHRDDLREKLPTDRQSINHHFNVAGFEGVLTMGLYADGRLGEIFVRMSKEGSTISGLMDSFATAISIAIQYHVPLSVLADKYIGKRFEPHGFTNNKEVDECTSVVDYIFRVLMLRFPPEPNG